MKNALKKSIGQTVNILLIFCEHGFYMLITDCKYFVAIQTIVYIFSLKNTLI